jgi:hypothetical protein
MNAIVKRCGACSKVLLNERRDYCDDDCKRDAAYTRERLAKGTKTVRKRRLRTPVRKRRLRTPIAEGVRNGSFSSSKSVASNPPSTPDFGAFVRKQIEPQRDKTTPASFTAPDGTKCRVWFASDREGNHIIGDDRWWRINVTDLFNQEGGRRPPTAHWRPTAETLRRPIIVVGRNAPIRNMDDALGVLKGFRVRICIEAEKELQVLGCGWRVVTCQFRGKTVLLHHNGNIATLKRKAFKHLVAAMRAIRPKRPRLRLVVSNPRPLIASAEAA